MYELRWIKRRVPAFHQRNEAEFGVLTEEVKVLQYRTMQHTHSRTKDLIISDHEWGDWIDVPIVEEE